MGNELAKFCSSGGCTAKLDPSILSSILHKIPKKKDDNLLVGYESNDDAAVYKLTDEIALVQTLDFFTSIVDDPFMFGKIAATNALSDVYAMGGEVKLALNISCFSEKISPEVLGEILRGGALKVHEAGGVLCGGHTVNDEEMKYGLSVTGVVHPDKILSNNNCKIGDKIILTKPIGVGIITTAYKVGEGSIESFDIALNQMQTLNKYAAQIMLKYDVHACTDVTGFGFLGHLDEMVKDDYSIIVDSKNVLYIDKSFEYAKEFLITAAGQKNRNHLKGKILMENIDNALQEILYDPQTSGGLLISVSENDSLELLKELNTLEIKSSIIGYVTDRTEYNICVK